MVDVMPSLDRVDDKEDVETGRQQIECRLQNTNMCLDASHDDLTTGGAL